jgi:hypothetical protein
MNAVIAYVSRLPDWLSLQRNDGLNEPHLFKRTIRHRRGVLPREANGNWAAKVLRLKAGDRLRYMRFEFYFP